MFYPDEDYESVIPTAFVTSYVRTLTDIPYEKEIFAELQKQGIKDVSLNEKFVFETEARYKLIDHLIQKEKADQVLELAAGYSSRGLNFALTGKTFVDTDLKPVATNKAVILQSIVQKVPDCLHILAGNALNAADYEQYKPFFDKNKKLAIVNEGLLRYLTFDEKKVVAENIHSLLSEFPGVWITCDITPKKFLKLQNQNLLHFNEKLSTLTPRNNLNDRFEDKEHIIDFFSKIGFDVEFYPFSDARQDLYSPKILKNYTAQEVDACLEAGLVAVFKIKN